MLYCPVFCKAQKINGPIVLNEGQFLLRPGGFYIAGVIDERSDQTAVAWLLPSTQITPGTPRYMLDLAGGASAAIKRFVEKSLPQDKSLQPVIIRIKNLRLDETAQPGGKVEGKLSAVFSFFLKKAEGDVHLTDYRGGSNYSRGAGQQMDVGALFSNSVQGALLYFNTWINRQAGTNIKLAKAVKLSFTDYTEEPEGDTIYYSRKRPLTWDDFQQKPPNSRYEAEVFPSIGYGEHVNVVNGIVEVSISVKAYLPKSACWVNNGG
ncbi:MAG TPA: hypothetical protein VIM77_14800, partial [Mucilaginibacter sp.]